MIFDPILRPYYDDVENHGVLLGDEIVCFKAGSLSQGEMAELYVRLLDDKIVEAKYKVFGCPYAIAMIGFVRDWVMGKTLSQCREFDFHCLFEAFDIPADKKHTAILAEDLLKKLSN